MPAIKSFRKVSLRSLEWSLIALMATRAARHRGTTADPYTPSGTVGNQLDVALEACALHRVLRWRVPEELPPGEVVTPFVLSHG